MFSLTKKKGALPEERAPIFQAFAGRLEADVRAQREAAALNVVEQAVSTAREFTRAAINVDIDAGERRPDVEHVVDAEAQTDLLVQFVAAVQVEQVVRRQAAIVG